MTGSGTLADPYIIQNVNDLQAMQNGLDAYYELGNNIDASGTLTWNWNAGRGVFEGFYRVGSWTNPFTGQLDGKGHTITGLYINRNCSTDGTVALFGVIQSSVIKNVNLANVQITTIGGGGNTTNNTGSLVGSVSKGCMIENCSSSGIVSGLFSGGLMSWVGWSTIVRDCHCSCAGASGGFMFANNGIVLRCYATGTAGRGGFLWGNSGYIFDCYATGNVGPGEAGGFVCWNYFSITRCWCSGNVTGGNEDHVGGFASANIGGNPVVSQIYECHSTGNVTGQNGINISAHAAGFIANNGGIVQDCYCTGNVTLNFYAAAGFASTNYFFGQGTIRRCYCTGHINIPGIPSIPHGFSWGNSQVYNSFWDVETSGTTHSDAGTGKTTAEMKTASTFTGAGWNFETMWNITGGYPFLRDRTHVFLGSGTAESPYIVANVNDLQAIESKPDRYFQLSGNIDASTTSSWNYGVGFETIRSYGLPFIGHLDGANHTVSGLFINRPSENYVGLFGQTIMVVEIKDLTLSNVDIAGGSQVGALLGLTMWGCPWCYAQGLYTCSVDTSLTTITNCHSSGSVKSTLVTGESEVGGLIGRGNGKPAAYGGRQPIINCSSSCSVQSAGTLVGGLIGREMYGDILNSYAIGNVSGLTHVGGLVGYLVYSALVSDCYAMGNVVASSYYAGGVFGRIASCTVITKSYATGNVSGDYSVGGFVGYVYNYTCLISQCYAKGNVSANYKAGGFGDYFIVDASDCYAMGDVTVVVDQAAGFARYGSSSGVIQRCFSKGAVSGPASLAGFMQAGSSPCTACFWDIETSGQTTSAGGVGKTSEEMNHIDLFLAAGWDFTTIWNISRVSTVKSGNLTSGSAVLDGLLDLTIINEAYPFLRWQSVVELPCDCGFEWGETELFGNLTPVDSKNTGESFAKALSGLEPQRTYYFRARASTSPGPIHGATKSFTTLHAIEVETLPATNITENSARIWGQVRKVPITAMAKFQWGGNIEYGAQTPWAPGLVSDDTFYYDLRNLAEGRAYHFRAMAMGSSLVYGNDMTFTTRSPVGPVTLIQEELAHIMEVA